MAIVDVKDSSKAQPKEAIKKTQFGIGDARFIQQILRSDVYSNKPRIIIQEYLSNARDAHREANKSMFPVDIKLPTSDDLSLVIRDYGPGVSPERFEKVFVQYGTSTKRDTDRQTGGFGIGAKSAWAYTDEFFVTSWTQEGGNMMERKYRCYVAGDGWCYGALESECINNNELQGTRISLDIKEDDIDKFVENFHNVTYFWGVRPNVLGNRITYKNWEESATGENWTLYTRYNGIRNGPVAIIDGIPYPVMPEELGALSDQQKELTQLPIHFHVDTGEVNIALSRESLTYNEKTINYLKEKLDEVIHDMTHQVETVLKPCKNFWLAQVKWHDEYEKDVIGKIIKSAKWNDIDVGGGKIKQTNWKVCKMHKISIDHPNSQIKPIIKTRKYDSWEYRTDVCIVINDTDKSPSPNRMISLFQANPEFKTAYVVTFDRESTEGIAHRDHWLNELHVKDMDPLYTSNYDRWKAPKGYVAPKKRTKLTLRKAHTKEQKGWGNNVWYDLWTTGNALELDQTTGFYIKTERGKPLIRETSHDIRVLSAAIHELFSSDDIYFTPKPLWNRVEKESKLVLFDDEYFKRISDYIQTTDISSVARQLAALHNHNCLLNFNLSEVMTGLSKCLPSDHIISEWYIKSKEILDISEELNIKLNRYKAITKLEVSIDEDNSDMSGYWKEIRNKYPLFETFSELYWRTDVNDTMINNFVDYVSMKDGKSYK